MPLSSVNQDPRDFSFVCVLASISKRLIILYHWIKLELTNV